MSTMSASYVRPKFNYEKTAKARPRNKMQEVPPLALAAMLVSFIFIKLAAKLASICFSFSNAACPVPVEVAMIAFAYQFVQYEVDINDPKMIQTFIDFFRETLTKYAPRYMDDDGTFINLNLGEIHDRLEKDNLASSVHVTAFGTRPCLKKGGPECINHIDRENHSICYHLGTTVTDAFRSITNRAITEKSIDALLNDIVVVDTHTRCGTKGVDNKFTDFRNEVDDDPVLSEFCARYKIRLELDEEVSIGGKTYDYCEPIIIDMLLGLFNLILYALYYYAVTKTALCVFISTMRTFICFETVGGNPFNALVGEMIIVGKGLHPNATELNLTNKGRYARPLKEVELMDEGLALSLQPFHGRTINFEGDNGEESGQIVMGPSDALQRTYNYRRTKKNRNDLEKREKELRSISKKLMAELERKHRQLERKQGQLERKEEKLQRKQVKLLSLNNRALELENQAKQQAAIDKNEKKRIDAAAKRKEAEALRDKAMADVTNKRAKLRGSAIAALSNWPL